VAILRNPYVALALGAALIAALAALGGWVSGPPMAETLTARAQAAIARADGAPVTARFVSVRGWPSRHPTLAGGGGLDEATRDRVAKAVAAIPGVGGIRWADGTALAQSTTAPPERLDCEEDVDALLRSRTIRFEEGSARIDAGSGALIDEVAGALRPCLGSIIAIAGHTDASGPEPGNLALSRERAEAVQAELVRRGISGDGLRARGHGSRSPVEGLDPTDPANRRIEFSVIATRAVRPTPVDTPGPR